MRRVTLLLLLFTAVSASADTVYKTVRPDGSVEYSAEPQPGAEQVKVPTLPTYESRTPAPLAPSRAESEGRAGPEREAGAQGQEVATDYSVSIVQPSPDQTIFFDAAGMAVSVSVNPALQTGEGHVVVIAMDGRERARTSGTSTTVTPERGTHTLVARVENEAGEVLATSDPVTFHMRQHSRLHPRFNPGTGRGAPSFP